VTATVVDPSASVEQAADETPIDPRREAFIDGLRQIADFLAEHPEVPLPYISSSTHTGGETRNALEIYLWGRDEMATVARALGQAVKSTHERLGNFYLTRRFAGIDLVASVPRDEVCQRVVVGTSEVEVEEPDPAAVAALPKVKRVEVVEQVEWRCMPLLADSSSGLSA
jgi:hypothetical protein